MDKSWITKPRLSQDYIMGIKGFLDFTFGKIKVDMLKCPCQRCCLVKNKLRVDIEGDLMCYGFLCTYTNWYLHGEELDDNEEASSEQQPNIDHSENTTLNLLADAFPSFLDTGTPSVKTESNEFTYRPEDPLKEKKAYDELLSDCNQALYDGCQSFSKLSFMLKLYHIKCISRISDKGMSMIIDLLKEAFAHAKFPDSFNDMKKTIRKLGLTYETIHVCPNDCMLYWGEDAARETCKVCEKSRWKASAVVVDALAEKKKKKNQQAAKILRYFPLKPRLQRLFMSSKTAEHMRWHAEFESKDDKLKTP